MTGPARKLDASTMAQRLREVTGAHHKIRHHSKLKADGAYEELAAQVKVERKRAETA